MPVRTGSPLSSRLPDFPWDSLAQARVRAGQHPGGLVDLTVGSPVDPTPPPVQQALQQAADAHAYPQVWGTPSLRRAILDHLGGRWNSLELPPEGVLPVIGTKWLVAHLPLLLGIGAGQSVVIPTVAYPTYEVGARLAGARTVACDDPGALAEVLPDGPPDLVWINSPSNPTGAVMPRERLQQWIDYCRAHDVVLASDECYGEFVYEGQAHSVLDAQLTDGRADGLLAVMSTSKESNMAGYRAGFVAGDPALVQELLALGRHLGMMSPTPVLAAMEAALTSREHVVEQFERYRRRRAVLRPALEHAAFRIDDSQGSLYLWASRDEPGRASVDWLAEHGILVAPGDFYGQAGANHVRVSLTATDAAIDQAAERLLAL